MILSDLALAAAPQGGVPQAPKPGIKILNVKLPPTIAWFPTFAPTVTTSEQEKWRSGCLAALVEPKVFKMMPILAISEKRVLDEMTKQGMDPATQKSTWCNDNLFKVAAKLKVKYVGQVDIFPIQPNVGVNKELVAVTGTATVYERATKKMLLQNEKFYVTGPLPKPGKGTPSDGYAPAVKMCETTIPTALKFAYLKATGQIK